MGRSGYFSWLKNLMPEIMRIWFFQKNQDGVEDTPKTGREPLNSCSHFHQEMYWMPFAVSLSLKGAQRRSLFSVKKTITDSRGAKVGCGFDG